MCFRPPSTSGSIKCPDCGTQNASDAKVCENCGAELPDPPSVPKAPSAPKAPVVPKAPGAPMAPSAPAVPKAPK